MGFATVYSVPAVRAGQAVVPALAVYGIGTMFSMAVLAAMVSIALDMVVRVAATFWTTALVQEFILKESMSDGMTSQAMQQGGMGLILTALILIYTPNGSDVLPGHPGHLHGIFADRRWCQCLAECRWSSAGHVGSAAGGSGVVFWLKLPWSAVGDGEDV
ncbi:hypothetical protein [Stenotrophomonas maltophilia]|uniref:hypothetical protein n=1 Tax=Stenotrophomonas maltophilia TaxID=40324 RepID=UPI0039C46998